MVMETTSIRNLANVVSWPFKYSGALDNNFFVDGSCNSQRFLLQRIVVMHDVGLLVFGVA